MALPGILLLTLAISAAPDYQQHAPIVIQNQPTSPDKPLIIEGYEISNPDGPGIQVRDVDYVVIRNNYLHDCGTKISEQRQRLVKETGDARKGMLDKPFETGAILVFDAKGTVEISGNEVRNNDYGIMVQGHRFRAKNVSVHDNKVQENHRAAFIWVGEADRVEIHSNFVKDNGLDVFFDNDGLAKAFEKGEDFGDGRTQGILTKDCNNVRIHRNTVINSVSDGIGIMNRGLTFDEDHRLTFDPDYEKHLVHDIEIFDNVIERQRRAGNLDHIGQAGKGLREQGDRQCSPPRRDWRQQWHHAGRGRVRVRDLRERDCLERHLRDRHHLVVQQHDPGQRHPPQRRRGHRLERCGPYREAAIQQQLD